jgi:hypothetical protein
VVKWQQPTNPHLTKLVQLCLAICNCFLVTNVNYFKIIQWLSHQLLFDPSGRMRGTGTTAAHSRRCSRQIPGTLATKTAQNKASIHKLTESVAGNMMLIPGTNGMVQVIHHGFATEVDGEFALVFVHGNMDEFPTFKVLNRESAVEPTAQEPKDDGPMMVAARQAPSFLSLTEAGNARDFGELLPKDNDVLTDFPNHFLIHPKVFALTMGARAMEGKHLAFEIIARIIRPEEEHLDGLEEGEQVDGEDYEGLLAFLWAAANESTSFPK